MEWGGGLVELKWKLQVTTGELAACSLVVLKIPLAAAFACSPVVSEGPGDPSGATYHWQTVKHVRQR